MNAFKSDPNDSQREALEYLEELGKDGVPVRYIQTGAYSGADEVLIQPNFSKANSPRDKKTREQDEAMLASPMAGLYENFLRRSAWKYSYSNQDSGTKEHFKNEDIYHKYEGNPHHLDNRWQIENALMKVEKWQRQGLVDEEGKVTAPEITKALKVLPVQVMLKTVDEGLAELKRICNEINAESGVDVRGMNPEEWVAFYKENLQGNLLYSPGETLDVATVEVFGKKTDGKDKVTSLPVHIGAVPLEVEGKGKKWFLMVNADQLWRETEEMQRALEKVSAQAKKIVGD